LARDYVGLVRTYQALITHTIATSAAVAETNDCPFIHATSSSSALYPRTDAFLESVREEITQQMWRLQSHASIALWGGSNENEASLDWYGPSKANRDLYAIDYQVRSLMSGLRVDNKHRPQAAHIERRSA
jgi:beta-galactosidase/beta-glucuronidase